ncbi:hypothetical protein V8E54_007919 [Elaphomyces granulatus]|jgi:hypothetical protein
MEPTVPTTSSRPLNIQGLAVHITFTGAKFDGYLVKLILDSQQPRFVISVANDMKALENGGHLIFPAQDNTFEMGIESHEPAGAAEKSPS